MNIVIVDNNSAIPGNKGEAQNFKQRLWLAVRAGLQRLGHECLFVNLNACNPTEVPVDDADAFIFWNGQKKRRREFREFLEGQGYPVICAEHGWVKRHEYFHFSVNGNFGPFAHFRGRLMDEYETDDLRRVTEISGVPLGNIGVRGEAVVSDDNRENLVGKTKDWLVSHAKTLGYTGSMSNKRKADLLDIIAVLQSEPVLGIPEDRKPSAGYVLLVQQVNGDAQHGDYDYDAVRWTNEVLAQLAQAEVSREIVIRSHPMYRNYQLGDYNIPSELESVRLSNGSQLPLSDDLATCEYIITFNSNAATEAILGGIPVIVQGPSLAVLPEVTLFPANAVGGGIVHEIQQMERGWQPDKAAVNCFLANLLKWQWDFEELAAGEVLQTLLAECVRYHSETKERLNSEVAGG